MSQINKVVLVGHLVRDPERKVTSSGCRLAVFTVASNHRYNDKQGAPKDEVAFVPCVLFGPPADWVMEYKKGTLVIVGGRLRTEIWEGADGKKSKLVLVVEAIQFVQSIKRESDTATLEPAGFERPKRNGQPPPF